MANINISINQNTDNFTIVLDKWEWTSLTVEGRNIPAVNEGDIQFKFKQEISGTIHFVATANHNINIVNVPSPMFLKGSDNNTYMCILSYAETASPKVVHVSGSLVALPYPIPGALGSPILFSQDKMTGTFQD
jgi:hypothetical protein